MEITREQILKLKNAYISNKDVLRQISRNTRNVEESFEQGWNNALEYVFDALNISQSEYEEVRFERLTAAEFRNLSPGDMAYIKIGEDYSVCEIESHPKINYDADEPDWEVETSIAWSDMDSLYKLV